MAGNANGLNDILILVVATLLAILAVNIPVTSELYESLAHAKVGLSFNDAIFAKPLNLWVNEGLMAVFFFYVVLEVRHELSFGVLQDKSAAILPVVAAFGGVVVPALIYYFFTSHSPDLVQGWAIPTATDIVFALALFKILFGKGLLPVKYMLLSLAIVDDILGILIIAFFYTSSLNLQMISFAAVGFTVLGVMRAFKLRYRGYYYIVGVMMWVAVVKSGVHATLAGVVLAAMIPYQSEASLQSLINELSRPVNRFILPLFAFFNAGVSLGGVSMEQLSNPMVLGVVFGLWLGKPLGVVLFTWVSSRLKLITLPPEMNISMLTLVGFISGIGFTLSLFIGMLAFGENPMYDNLLRLGVFLGSILSGVSAYILGVYWRRKYVR